MMIFKKSIPRRAFLRGLGATLALPLLDGMAPAFAAIPNSPRRFSVVYVPNGIIMEKWTPATEGSGFEITPTLEPLTPFRDQMLVLSGLDHNTAEPLPGEGEVAPHERAGATYLTGVHPKREGEVGVSVDQIAAKELGRQTQLASLEVGLDSSDIVGQCERGWSCAYIHTLSWRTPTTPLPMENQPRIVFERLFGDNNTTDTKERLDRIQRDRSLLDSVMQAAADLGKDLTPSDRIRLGEYLDGVRDIERRIQMAEEQASREMPKLDRPAGIPPTFDEHAKLMFDLQIIALQTDLTRVITFMMSREQADRTYREIGIPDAHHPLTHHQNDPAKIAKVIQINQFHTKMLAYYLDKLKNTRDGNGSLLNSTMVVYGSCISDGNKHLHQNLPTLLLGGSDAQVKGGRHIRYAKGTPMSNLYVTVLDKLGVPVENFGDSNGKLQGLSGV